MGLKNRDGIWYIVFQYHGQTIKKSTGLAATERNRSAANKHEQRLRDEARSQARMPMAGPAAPEEASFSSKADEFIEWCKTEYRGKPNTWRRKEVSFASLRSFFGDKPVGAITAGDVEAFKVWRANTHQVRDVTIRHDLDALSLFFQWAAKAGACAGNPVGLVKRPSDAESIRMYVLSDDDERDYLPAAAKASSDLHDLATLMLNQGCRPEEIMALRPEHFLEATGELHILKGKSPAARRKLRLTHASLAVLLRRKVAAEANGYRWLFPSPRKPGQHIVKLNNAHDRALELINTPTADDGRPLPPRNPMLAFVLYDLRHTFATRLAATGCPLPTLAAILGHSSLRMVMRYVHPTEQDKARAMVAFDQARNKKTSSDSAQDGQPS